MKNNKWIDVAILKEFFQYFNIEELAELSLCSKLFRLKLARVIFKIIKLDSLKIKKFGYKSCVITEKDSEYNDKDIEERVEHYRRENYGINDEELYYPIDIFTNPYKPLTEKLIESREKFQSDLKIIPYQPSELIIQSVFSECYLFPELHITFSNLKSLHIMLIWITFEDLQYLLNNLECLEDLQFTSNYIFKSEPEPVDFSINWPQTLKKLTIGRNTELLVYNKYDPIPIDPNEYYLDLPKTQHLLLPTHLPNLESLSLKHWEGKFDDKLEFLKACPQIKKLSFPSVEEIPQIFNIIRSFNNLEHLEILLDSFGYEKESEIINFTIPCNLKSLTIQCRYYPYVIQFFNESFLQITSLNVISLYLSFDELLLFINNLSAMQLLKKLKLSFELNLYEFNEVIGSTVFTPIKTNIIKFPKLDNLESIEFKSISKYDNYNIKMDLSQFKFRIDECPKLKCIGFRSDTKSECFGEIGSNKLGLGDDWRLISTPRRYLLHKVNQ